MDDTAVMTEFRNLRDRVGKMEQILPTLATRDDLRREMAEGRQHTEALVVATRDDLRREMAEGRQHTEALVAATKDELRGEIAATRDELRGEIAATRDELRGEIASTRDDLRGEIAESRHHAERLAAENRHYTDERTNRLEVLIESLRDDVRLIAEAQVAGFERQDRMWDDVRRTIVGMDHRILRLEARMPPDVTA